MINNAKEIYTMRDGIASFFFHTFVNTDYLIEMADKISRLGFTFIDLRLQHNIVKDGNVVILTGNQAYTLNLNHDFLYEVYYSKEGIIEKKVLSKKPISGVINKKIILKPDEFYFAEPLKKIPDNTLGKNNKVAGSVSKVHS
jgi:hypothetical protein